MEINQALAKNGLNHCLAMTKNPCVIHTICSTNPKHSPMLAAMKEVNSIPAKTNAASLDSQDIITELPGMTTRKLGFYGATLQARHGISGILKGTRSL